MAKSITEIKNEILSKLNVGIDNNDGSFVSSLIGAIATQIVMLDQTIQDVKIQQYPEFADMETLVLLGRKCGLFPLAATPSRILISIVSGDPKYVVGSAIRFRDAEWAYTVLSVEDGNKYVLECTTPGAASNEIPISWRTSSVEIETTTPEDQPVLAKVDEIRRYGRDPEDISQFRLRVMAAHNVAPMSANEHWLRTVLTQGDLPIECVRVVVPIVLTQKSAATVRIYVGGQDFAQIPKALVTSVKETLRSQTPIGMVFDVESVFRLDAAVGDLMLTYTFQLTQDSMEFARTEGAKERFRGLIRDFLRKLILRTSPRESIVIIPGELVGTLHEDNQLGNRVVSATIIYRGVTYTDKPCQFDMRHIPWVTPEQIKLVDSTMTEIKTGIDVPEM